MAKNYLFLLFLSFISSSAFGQSYTLSGKVVDIVNGKPLSDIEIHVENTHFTTKTDINGSFFIEGNLPPGNQIVLVEAEGFTDQRLPVLFENGLPVHIPLIPLEVNITEEQLQIGIISLSDQELNADAGDADYSISGLLSASKDAFLTAAAYDFSATFFRPRGLGSERGKILINGIEMNKLYSGRPQWGNWGGLNDMQRNRIFTLGTAANDYTFGGLAGTTNIIMRASQYRRGGRVSYASSNRTYKGRIIGSYNSGLNKNGWAYSVSLARRYGNEGYMDGSLYDANSIFIAVEKEINPAHSLNFSAFYTPNRRGKSSANTQEVIDLKGRRYNSYWGKQDGEIRNSRTRKIKEPVFMLNHYWNLSEKININTNVAYQFGSMGNSRLGYDNAPNPDPGYYQKLPSYFIGYRDSPNRETAYRAYENFTEDGQINWDGLYKTNILYGGNACYYLYEDRVDDKQLTANSIVNVRINDNVNLNASINLKSLTSHNYANTLDLLGATTYLDIDTFNTGDAAQSDLNNPNRRVGEGEIIKYNFEINALQADVFMQAQFSYNRFDFFLSASGGTTTYQRNGLFKNGNYPEDSEGKSDKLSFAPYGIKGGMTYKYSGRHIFTMNSAYLKTAPVLRNAFSNSRQNNRTVINLQNEGNINLDLSYIYRDPIVSARLTGYYIAMNDATEISFYYADGISGLGRNVTTAFVQEVLTNVDKTHLGGELGIEAQLTPTIKVKGAAAYGQYTYSNNPDLYLTSDDFNAEVEFGQANLKNYRIAGGPQQAFQLGFEYRDPEYWFFGTTANYFSHAYVDIAPLTRTKNFYQDTDGLPFNDYDPQLARELLKQERFEDYMLVNAIGGKSWRVGSYYVGFFAVINNVLNTTYKTGGFEQGRSANFRTLQEDAQRETRIFGPKYWSGYGTSYYLNFYIRF
ncbi:TonB-dependent receptor [Flavimarina sp. Hel_I_48]|uniref:TonB-dependent receptor n=1 Tax=Flavimarina sp. Hel_I_48 TaxID=1392488 RepID=UPI0004DED9D7|nr:TonB-dependent receptor [Flavimarina sp. Hel_I_48]